MADKFDTKTRSRIMSKIRSKNTSVEIIAFRYLAKNRIHFQKHYRTRFGINIDIALPRKKRAVFIDGEFWHGKTFMIRKHNLPEYWVKKISRNMERDLSYNEILKENGWHVLRVWEDDIKKGPEEYLEKIKTFLI